MGSLEWTYTNEDTANFKHYLVRDEYNMQNNSLWVIRVIIFGFCKGWVHILVISLNTANSLNIVLYTVKESI